VRERSADSYDFTHDKLREVVYNSLSAARRRLFHKRVAGALEAVYVQQTDAHPHRLLAAMSGPIATHYEMAGVFDKAIDYYQQAAAAAHQLSANGEAVRAYRRALALAEGPAGLQHAIPLYERLGDLLHGMSQYAEARTIFTQALAHAALMDAVQCARCHRKIGNTWREQYDYAHALQFYAAAEAALEHAESLAPYRTTHTDLPSAHPRTIRLKEVGKVTPAWWEEWIQTQLEIDLVHYWLGETDASATLQRRLQPIVEQHGAPGQQAAFFQRRGQLAFRCHRSVAPDVAVADAQRAFTIYQEAEMQDHLPAAHFMLGFFQLWHDDLTAATAELTAALQLAEQQGDCSLQTRALTYLTIAARRSDQVTAAQTLVTQALTAANTAHMPEYIALARANQAWLAWRQQEYSAVREHGAAALAVWQQLPITHASAPFQWTALWPLLAEALQREDVVTAVGYARTLVDPHQQQLPDALATPLTQAMLAWESSVAAEVQRRLAEAVTQAEQCHYL
jgi:tetratricopeptide (TPR) repeat protein